MKDINPTDLLEVRPQSLFSTQDYDYLFDLYSPILGVKSICIYLALIHFFPTAKEEHKKFYLKNQITPGEFVGALSGLEAMGLIQTFKRIGNDVQEYCYCTFSPRTPKEFLSNELLAGTLTKYAGEQYVKDIEGKYEVASMPDGYDDVSESFVEFFTPDLSDSVYGKKQYEVGGRTSGSLKLGFDRNLFMKALLALDPRFTFNSFSRNEWVKIARIGTLYNYSEETMAGFVRESFLFVKPIGERLNVVYLQKLASDNCKFAYLTKAASKDSQMHGDTPLARTIRLMERKTPVEFLSILQKNNKPAKPDLELIHTLTTEMGLSHPVCNALILYVISTNDNKLSSSYTQKLAGSLVRSGIDNVVDAMDFFNKEKDQKKQTRPTTSKPKNKISKTEDPISELEVQRKSGDEEELFNASTVLDNPFEDMDLED